MSRVRHSRTAVKLSDSLNRRLNNYAQVATAAGVSLLALTVVSEAKVIYTETHEVVHTGYPLFIDLNHDGIKDFFLRTTYYVGSSGIEVGLDAFGYGNANNRVAGRRFSVSGYFLSGAYALRSGARIGPKAKFSVPFPLMAAELFSGQNSQDYDLGAWAGGGKGVKNRYLGLRFDIDGSIHYGWARLSVTLGHQRHYNDVSGTLTGYAYETEPGKAIVAGQVSGPDEITLQPGTLGGLARGRK